MGNSEDQRNPPTVGVSGRGTNFFRLGKEVNFSNEEGRRGEEDFTLTSRPQAV